MKLKIIFLIPLVISAAIFFFVRSKLNNIAPSDEPPEVVLDVVNEDASDMEVVAENLTIPWDIAFLPDGALLVTEREGNLIHLDLENGEMNAIHIEGVRHAGEGGLLGIVLHPKFRENNYLYLYFTSSISGLSVNSVVRFKYEDNELSERKVIVDDIPGKLFHNGGRIDFGPDGFLYITTGDAQNPGSAQDKNSLSGKILRVKDDGSIPISNPFGNAVYSYGHRNSQGLAWDEEGRLWSTEHGRSGVRSGLDELNLIENGANYGWPYSQGDEVIPGTVAPNLHSGADTTWAPASALYRGGSIFFGGLRGETLYEAVLSRERVAELREHYVGEFGRIRTVRIGPDGLFYLTTSNRDGRGQKREGDDKIIRLNPQQFRRQAD